MGVDLKYNLEEYDLVKKEIEEIKKTLLTNKNNMLTSLSTLRTDWVSDGGTEFFKEIDGTWKTSVDKCVSVLEDIIEALEKGAEKYEQIEVDTPNYLSF